MYQFNKKKIIPGAILLTGGTGYIGTHVYTALIQSNYEVIILDNLSNSTAKGLVRLEKITSVRPIFIKGDLRNRSLLKRIFSEYPISAVIHLAGLKSVSESCADPILYYDNNVAGTLVLLNAMQKAQIKTFVFSSSATVYGNPDTLPICENNLCSPINAYGNTKLLVEKMLSDVHKSKQGWKIIALRYFNPIGAHVSGLIGENPKGIPNNLMPYILQVAAGLRKKVFIYGDDYNTPDGTGVRDYIHVVDLAEGHVAALNYCMNNKECLLSVNLGAGEGKSVLQVIREFENVNNIKIPYQIIEKRTGDIAESWADPSLALKIFEWKATKGLAEMCEDSWRWQKNNPNGYT